MSPKDLQNSDNNIDFIDLMPLGNPTNRLKRTVKPTLAAIAIRNKIKKINNKIISLEQFIRNALGTTTQKASIKQQQQHKQRKAKSESYLLGKMINDVSKMISNDSNNKHKTQMPTTIASTTTTIKHESKNATAATTTNATATTTTTATIKTPHIYNELTTIQCTLPLSQKEPKAATQTKATTTATMPCLSAKLAAFNEETTLMTLASTSTSTTALTSPPTSTSTAKLITATTTTATTTTATMPAVNKAKSTENKCTLRESFNFSNHRESKAYTSAVEQAEQQCKQDEAEEEQQLDELKANKELVTLEAPVAQAQILHKGLLQKEIGSTLTLAERKAKLKAQFFNEITTTTTKRSLHLNNNNLKLKIPKTEKPCAAATVLVGVRKNPTTLIKTNEELQGSTLVKQRKWQLENKFKQQQEPLTKTGETKTIVTEKTALESLNFPRVGQLVRKFDTKPINLTTKKPATTTKMIVGNTKPGDTTNRHLSLKSAAMEQRNSPMSDEGCNLGQSPYSSDNEDNDNGSRSLSTAIKAATTTTTIEDIIKNKEKVARSASSDSALGLDVDVETDDVAMDTIQPQSQSPPPSLQQQQRRSTLTVTDLPLRAALLPLAEPTALPDSPTAELQQTFAERLIQPAAIPSKVLLEERVVEIPDDPRSQNSSESGSRRESSQSCLSDYHAGDCPGVRFVRTPSVVVSDYSDDVVCGITLEEIEYFRAQRMRRRRSSLDTAGNDKDTDAHSDVSASSSCSNLYYCGSTISALDGAECYVNGMRLPLERKASDCSQCSMTSGDEDNFTIPEQPEETTSDIAALLAAQHLNTKRAKKVGATTLAVNELQPHTFG